MISAGKVSRFFFSHRPGVWTGPEPKLDQMENFIRTIRWFEFVFNPSIYQVYFVQIKKIKTIKFMCFYFLKLDFLLL